MELGLRVEFTFAYSWPPAPHRWDTGGNGLGEYDLWTVLGGEGQVVRDGAATALSSGDCLLLRPRRRCVITHNPDNPLALFPVHFNFVDARGEVVHPSEDELPAWHRKIADLAFFRSLLERVAAAHVRRADEVAACFLRAALLEADNQAGAASGDVGDGLRASRVNGLCRRMVEHPERDYSVRALAREMRLSRSRFFSLFKETTGVTPAEHLINVRMAKAKTLLRCSSANVTDIALSLGYRSASFFCRQFKDRNGVSPRRYRET